MAYYVKFEFWIPRLRESESDLAKVESRMAQAFQEFAYKKYGGFTGWNSAVPGFQGYWELQNEP